MLLLSRLLAVLALSMACPAHAQDYAREKRWLDEVSPGVVVGDPVMIKAASGREFLALYTEVKNPHASIVLVHGIGVHPDHGIIGALRTRLADLRYNTLSIQMPVLAAEAPQEAYPPLFPDAADRIAKAADWLQARGQSRLVLLSHSMGSWMANAYFDGAGTATPYRAWIALGLGRAYSPAVRGYAFPVLDVYGEQDLPPVLAAAAARRGALHAQNGSRQIRVAGADHFYAGRETQLAAAIDAFLSASVVRK
jgi:pimeloyl-ACP methyl ester carboxylesterase